MGSWFEKAKDQVVLSRTVAADERRKRQSSWIEQTFDSLPVSHETVRFGFTEADVYSFGDGDYLAWLHNEDENELHPLLTDRFPNPMMGGDDECRYLRLKAGTVRIGMSKDEALTAIGEALLGPTLKSYW
jgi:hypothetical protein